MALVANRIITNETGIDGHRIRTGRMNDKEWDVLNRTIENIATYPIFLTDKNNWEIEYRQTHKDCLRHFAYFAMFFLICH